MRINEIEIPDTIDGKPTRNSLGKLIHPTVEGIKNFWRWFGDSKVVDSQGRPLVVYHGTIADFEYFDNSKTGSNDRGLWGRGHYFSSVSNNANSYALRQGDESQVILAYVSIKNPLVLKTGNDLIIRLPDGTNYKDFVGPNLDGTKIKNIAISGNHDGVIQFRPNGMIGDIVAYNSNQIKSAIGNNGNFSVSSNKITEIDSNDYSPDSDAEDYSTDYPSITKIKQNINKILQVSQKEYDDWNEDDIDTYAGGGICHLIADSICSVLFDLDVECSSVSSCHEQHVYVAVKCKEGLFTIDIPHWIYETGGGFNWKKIPDVKFEERDIQFYRVSSDPEEFDAYTENW